MVECKNGIENCMALRVHMKMTTQDHAASKPDMLQHSEVKLGLTTSLNEDEDEDSLFKVGIAMVCFFITKNGDIGGRNQRCENRRRISED